MRTCTSPTSIGSRVKSGSMALGDGATVRKSTHPAGTSTRGTRSTRSFTWATTIPSRNAVASTMAGVSSVFGPV